MSPLRILHVVPYYDEAWAYGGIPRLATAMTQGLARRGHEVTVCTTDAYDATSRIDRPDRAVAIPGLHVHTFPNLSNRLAYHWQFFMPVGLATHLRRRARHFDIAHLHACRNLPGVIAARMLHRSGVPYVISPNGTAPVIERRILAKRLFDRTVGLHTLARSARVVAATAAERDQLLDLGFPPARIAVVPNPIDEREFASEPERRRFRQMHGLGEAPVVLFLGKLTPRKGVDVLLRAFRQLDRPGTRLVIAGNDMGSGQTVTALATALGLQGCIHRIGLLKGRDRLDALGAADVVVYPSRDEVFGLVALEALLCGTPVVVCNDCGCGEIIGQIGGGDSVPYGDPSRLAHAMASILDGGQMWRLRAREAGARVRARFGATVVCQRLEDLYQEVLHQHRGAA